MPAFHSLESADIKAVVTYLRTLQGTKKAVTLPGDPKRGETIFFAKAGCSACHMIAGKGGFIASDLSAYAGTHAVEQIRKAITSPTPGSDHQARSVTATSRGGEKYVGITFHFVAKSDLEGLEYNSQALMPSDYGSTLSSSELNDVISYLISAANTTTNPTEARQKEFEEE